jgi:hypothetical protein
MNVPWGHLRLARLAGAASTLVDLSGLLNVAHAHPLAQTTTLWTTELLVSIQELTEATTAIVETVVKDNNTVTNEIAMMAIMISVATSTIVTYVLSLNRELGTVRPMKPVIAWSTIWSTVPRAPSNSPTTYDKSSGLEVFSLKSLTIMTARSIPSYGSNFMRPLCRSAMGDEHVMANYFPVVVGPMGHQWLVSLPKNHFDSWYAFASSLCRKLHCYL